MVKYECLKHVNKQISYQEILIQSQSGVYLKMDSGFARFPSANPFFF